MRDQGTLLFGSAGNGVDNHGVTPLDVDAEDCFIACWEEGEWEPCEDDGVDCVTALDFESYSRYDGANYGSEDVDLAAPWFALDARVDGTNRFSLIHGGTSAATAFTGGATTLVFAADPSPLETADGRARSADNVERCIYAASNPVRSAASGRYWNVLGAIKCMATGSTTGDLPGRLVIETPSDGSQVGWMSFDNVRALATDPESGTLTIQWTSDVDGALAQTGSEQTGTVVFRTPGPQHLTATAVTGSGQVLTQTITVNVTPAAPEVVISQPSSDGQSYPASLPVTFVATAAGLSGTFAPDSAFVWSSQAADGAQDFVGLVGRHIQPSFASVGDHVVTVVYTEQGTGATATATRTVHVVASTSLGVTITNPVLTNTGQAQQPHDLPLTLAAQATASANYAWEVVTDAGTISLGGGQSRSWDPATDTPASCFEQEVLLRVTATDGIGGVAVDAIPLLLYPSPEEIHDLGCVR
jgi:hypothetical protein